MNTKRPIDVMRDAAVELRIGDSKDQSPVVEMLTIGIGFFAIKENAVYRIKLADETDPDRSNAAVPHTQIRVLDHGSQSEILGRTLLTAHALLRKEVLPPNVDCPKGLELAFEASKALAAALRISEVVVRDVNDLIDSMPQQTTQTSSIVLPSLSDAEAQVRAFMQQIDSALQQLAAIARIFYGDSATKQWFDSLPAHVAEKHEGDEEFGRWLTGALPFLRLVRAARNAVEHPGANQRVTVRNFSMNANAEIVPPLISVDHALQSLPETLLPDFLSTVVHNAILTFEAMLAFFCSRHVRPLAGLEIELEMLLPDQRTYPYVQYAYFAKLGDRWERFG